MLYDIDIRRRPVLYPEQKVVAFCRKETLVFDSISDAAIAFGLYKNVIVKRIEDGCTLKDGYTTLDYLYDLDDTIDDWSD
jgi:hypothetical protein